MKCLVIFLLFIFLNVNAEDLDIGGNLVLNRYFLFKDSIIPYPTFDEVYTEISLSGSNYKVFTSFKLRVWNRENVSFSQLSTFPVETYLYPWELYVKIDDFFIENLDLKAGKQRIAWGSADKLNPTDNINPFDMQDIFDINKRLPVDALKTTYYLPFDISFSAILSKFTPSLFGWDTFFIAQYSSDSIPEGFSLSKYDTIIYPEKKNFKDASFAFKLSGTVFNWDMSVSYLKGFYTFPFVDSINIYPQDTITPFDLNMDTYLSFPEYQCIGYDFAGEIFTIGLWAEAAILIPQEFTMRSKKTLPTGNPQMPFLTEERDTTILNTSYFRYTIGSDYTFKSNTYINIQWNHGFFYENSDLNDYMFFYVEQTFRSYKITLKGGIEIDDFAEVNNSYGFTTAFEFNIKPYDNIEFLSGISYFNGKEGTFFRRMKDVDNIYIVLKGYF